MKKVAIIGSAGVPPKYGGFETLAGQLVVHLRHKFQIYVYCSSRLYAKDERISNFETVKPVYLPFQPNGAQSILYDITAMLHAVRKANILLILGVSGGIFLPVVRLFFRGKIIVHPDGIEWKRLKWNWLIRKYLKLSEYMAIRSANVVISDNRVIQDYLTKVYGIMPVLIEYGGNPAPVESDEKNPGMEIVVPESYFLALGRIEPENNPELILKTFKDLSGENLVFIGNWQRSKFGRKLYKQFHAYENIYLLDPVYDQQQLSKIRLQANVYIHGHSAGGTNPSLVEALFSGLPVFAFDVAFNREVTENKAFYFQNSSELIAIIKNTSELLLKENGNALKAIADRRFDWKYIIEKYSFLLDEIL